MVVIFLRISPDVVDYRELMHSAERVSLCVTYGKAAYVQSV